MNPALVETPLRQEQNAKIEMGELIAWIHCQGLSKTMLGLIIPLLIGQKNVSFLNVVESENFVCK